MALVIVMHKDELLLVKVTQDLATSVLATGFLMVHNASRGSQDDKAKLTRGEQVFNPVFHLWNLDVKAGRDNTTLVEATVQVDDNLSRTVVINDFKFINIT